MWDRLLLRPALAVFLLAVVVHLPSLAGSFVYDDHYIILGDAFMRQSNPLPAFQINLWDLYGIQISAESSYYRPLARLCAWCVYQLAGPQAWAFHLANTLVHALNCAMITILGRQFFRSPKVALIGGALFALHPRHVEPLAWPTAITDLFCSCAALAYLLLCRKAALEAKPLLWLAAGVALLLSALTKESGLLIPGLALLGPVLEVPAWERPAVRRTLWGVGITALAAGLVYFYLRIEVGHASWPGSQGLPFGQRLMHGPYIFAYLLRLAVWPFGYGLFRGPVMEATPAHWQWWLSVLITVLFVALLVRSWRRWPSVCFCLLWWAYNVAPVLGVLAPIPSLMSDRHIYLSVAALTWLIGLTYQRFPSKLWPKALAATALVYLAITWQQIWVWSDEAELWRQSKRTCPRNTVPRANLAWILAQRQQYSAALQEYQELIRLGPEYSAAYLGSADVLARMREFGQAEQIVQLALQRNLSPRPKLLQKMGEIFQAQGLHEKALEAFAASLKLAPGDLGCRFLLANSLAELHQYEQARREYRSILAEYPRSQGSQHNVLLLDYKEAVYRRSLGDNAGAQNCLKRLLEQADLPATLRIAAEQEMDQLRPGSTSPTP